MYSFKISPASIVFQGLLHLLESLYHSFVQSHFERLLIDAEAVKWDKCFGACSPSKVGTSNDFSVS